MNPSWRFDNDPLIFKQFPRAIAPWYPILFAPKLIKINSWGENQIKVSDPRRVNVEFSFKASAKAMAPSSPMLLTPILIESISEQENQTGRTGGEPMFH
jgi:hypothetical protein